MLNRDAHEQNRRSWNAVTPAHNRHKVGQGAFLRDGGSTLFPEEIDLLGPLQGLQVLHQQCNCGQDTLSLARLGAQVTGVDISDDAIAVARQLSEESGLPARFSRADVFDYLAETDDRFDILFASYGALGWLSDLSLWARLAARVLKPGGRVVILEFHPLLWSFTADGAHGDAYFADTPFHDPGVNDYVGASGAGLIPFDAPPPEDASPFTNPEPCVGFQWTTAQILQALLDAGLRLRRVVEYPYSNGFRPWPEMAELPGRKFTQPAGKPSLPLMLGLDAARPA